MHSSRQDSFSSTRWYTCNIASVLKTSPLSVFAPPITIIITSTSHPCMHACSNKNTNLCREGFLHILLHPAQEERLQLLMDGCEGRGVTLTIGLVVILKILPVGKSADRELDISSTHTHTHARTRTRTRTHACTHTYFLSIMKWRRDHSSFSEFWRGVPVIKSL